MLTDEVKIRIFAGNGGDGVVAFDKAKMAIGPTGGRGGNGGNIFFEGVSNLSALNKFRHKKEYRAEDGENGKHDRSTGENGKDLILQVPIGSVLKNLKTGDEVDITEAGQKIMAAKGGLGGRGNFYFRSPMNTSPKEFEEGKMGEDFEFLIELRLIADVGFIGLPNAGKSSLLNELTKANAKVGNYSFTTLEPNLGVLDGIIIADIPGLIEGASQGKGLGIKFLKHIKRTKFLVHCISAESNRMITDYNVVRKELAHYNPELTEKEEVVVLTKNDLFSAEEIESKLNELEKDGIRAVSISVHDWDSLEKFKQILRDFLDFRNVV